MNYYLQHCRLCTSNKNISFNIFNLDSDGKSFIDKLTAIIPEIVECNIKLSTGLCTICAVKLNEAYKFIKQCLDTQIILKQRQLNEQLCRLCASNENISLTLNSMDSDNILIFHKLETIASEILECNENLSKCICSTCSIRLNETYKFKQKCFKSQEILKLYAKQQLQNSEVIKNEIMEDDSSSCRNEDENNINFETVFIKEEILDEEPIQLGLEYDTNIKVKDNLELEYSKNEQINATCSKTFKIVQYVKKDIDNLEDIDQNSSNTSNVKVNIQTLTGELCIRRKLYKCKICDKSCTRPSELKIHTRKHTGERPYNCEICNKGFSAKVNLTTHMRKHTGERPFQCETCHKTFSTGGILTMHIRTHTGEKPYHCETCNKTFAYSGTLTEHIRTHTGEKPYTCKTCKKSFNQISHLKSHSRIHTT